MAVTVKTVDSNRLCWERFSVVAACGHTYLVTIDTDEVTRVDAYRLMVEKSERGCVDCRELKEKAKQESDSVTYEGID